MTVTDRHKAKATELNNLAIHRDAIAEIAAALEAAAAEARREAFEEAAKVADEQTRGVDDLGDWFAAARLIANTIRARAKASAAWDGTTRIRCVVDGCDKTATSGMTCAAHAKASAT